MPPGPFEYFDRTHAQAGAGAHWLARAPQRPDERFDLTLLPRSPTWREDATALAALAEVERQPWAERLTRVREGAQLRLSDRWIETIGAALERRELAQPGLAELASGRRFAVQFCDVGALHLLNVGDLRGLALGSALAAALERAGASVERRSLVSGLGAGAGEGADAHAQRHDTLTRLGIGFDRIVRESSLHAAPAGRPADARDDDAPPTLGALRAYWKAAPGLEGATSVHVCERGSDAQLAHATRSRDGLAGARAKAMHPTRVLLYGPVSTGERASEGTRGELSIDELLRWLEGELERDRRERGPLAGAGEPGRLASQIALGYFLPRAPEARVDLFVEKLLRNRESPGWDLVRARARDGRPGAPRERPVRDHDYRFAVVQSQLQAGQLQLVLERLDPRPLAWHTVQLARWYLQAQRGAAVTRVVHTTLDGGAGALGLR